MRFFIEYRLNAFQGYYGGMRLILATCNCFASRCKEKGLENRITQGFCIKYDTSIPRMVKLIHIHYLIAFTFAVA